MKNECSGKGKMTLLGKDSPEVKEIEKLEKAGVDGHILAYAKLVTVV